MQDIDLSGVAPLRRAETLRRIQVIRDYLGIAEPTPNDRKTAAESLGIGTQQFTNLVRAWRLKGSAMAIAKAGAKAGAPRPPRKRGLPPSTRAAAEDALRRLPASAKHSEAIAAVQSLCRERGTRPPSDSMVSYLRLAVRQSGAAADGDPGIVIGRAVLALTMLDGDRLVLPELALAVSTRDGRVIVAAILDEGAAPPRRFQEAVSAYAASIEGPVNVGVDDEAICTGLPRPKVVSRFVAGRLLAKAIGRGINGLKLAYGPLASTDPTRPLRAKADAPLDRGEILDTLGMALSEHNTARDAPPPVLLDARCRSSR